MQEYQKLKNIAIVAHVDHGKTTLIDGLLAQSGVYQSRDEIVERVMDSGELERERGITINAKNCAIFWGNTKINLLDTPGHADFGGEVERSLMVVDGILLLVDASEGPLPQTRFVLSKAIERKLKIAVIINKIDRPDERIEDVRRETEDLLLELAAASGDDEFAYHVPFLYASAKEGYAFSHAPAKGEKGDNLHPILDFMVSDYFPPPWIETGDQLRLLISSLSYSNYLGPIVIGRIQRGTIKRLNQYTWCGPQQQTKNFKVSAIQIFHHLTKLDVEEAGAGEIVLVAGLEGAKIGDSICATTDLNPLPRIFVEPPTVAVHVSVSTSPLSGQEGEYLTSRKLQEFLVDTCRHNVALQYEETSDPKVFILKGRGELQLGIVFEELRRKGFEFMVSRPEVLLKTENGQVCEPFEKLVIDIPSQYTGVVTEKLAQRKGKMDQMLTLGEGRCRLEFTLPSRGLIGYRSTFLTDTKGEGLMSSYFLGYFPESGKMLARQNGALIADRAGKCTPYALYKLLSSGKQFVLPGEVVYEGMVVGEHTKTNDMNVNVVREKHLSGVRTAGKDENIILPPIRPRTLDWAFEWIDDDEWVEITPKNIRIRKKNLKQNERSVIR